MAIPSDTIWEVQTGGVGTNGGAWANSQKGATGTDHSQSAHTVFTVTTNGTTTVTATVGSFDNTMLGNGINIASDNIYIITAYTNSTTITVDRNTANGGAGISAVVGGPFATPGYVAGFMVAGNRMWVKTGTYTTTTTTVNISGGPISISQAGCAITGYSSSRGDNSQATVKCGAALGAALFAGGGNMNIENMIADGNSVTNSKGFNNGGHCYNCTAKNTYYEGFPSPALCFGCAAINCGSAGDFGFTGNTCINCYATGNSGGGFGDAYCWFCVAYNNTGVGFSLAYDGIASNCSSVSNSSHGFALSSATRSQRLDNCIAVSNGGYGVSAGTANWAAISINNTAFYGNTSGATQNILYNNNPITLTASPFNNPSGGDFGLNNTANAGAACRNISVPGTWLGPSSTTSYLDIGAIRHQDPSGGGGLLINPGLLGGLN